MPSPTIAFHEAGIVRLRYRPSPTVERPSCAVIAAPADVRVRTERRGGLTVLETEALRLELGDGSLRALDRAGTVLLEEGPGSGLIATADGRSGVLRPIAAGERFFGFGEKTEPLDKRGRSMVMWNTDAFDPGLEGWRPDQDPLYQSIPFFIGLRGLRGGVAYGLLVDDPRRLTFDMGASEPGAYRITSAGEPADQYLLAGPHLADVVRRYTWLTGRMPLPPRWALGFHQSRWGYYPDAEVREICRELRARRIPCDGIWLDIEHMDGYRSFTWDPVGFPRPRELTAELGQRGFKTVVIADPGLKADPAWDTYAEAQRDGHLLSRGGRPYLGRVWPGAAAWPDFTSPAARAFWARLVARPLADGVRGVWVDMNEPANQAEGCDRTVPDDLPVHGDGVPATMAEAHNLYGLLMARATAEGMLAAAPDRRPFVLTRAGAAGIQRYAAIWTGDAPSRWDVLAQTPAMLANLGLSGCGLVGSDVGGFAGRATPELYVRWMQLGALSPFFRVHCQRDGARQEPWAFGPEVEELSRRAIRARYALLPYLYSLVAECAATGAPPLRPLAWEFQDDPEACGIGDQLLLGPWLLAAPVLVEGARRRALYLPAGRWIDLASGEVHVGPGRIEVPAPLDTCPMFLREGGIIPRFEPLEWSDERPPARLELDCFPGERETSFTLYEDDGETLAHERGESSRVTYRLRREDGRAVLEIGAREGTFVPAPRRLQVRIREAGEVAEVRLGGAPAPYQVDAATRSVLVGCEDVVATSIEVVGGRSDLPPGDSGRGRR